MQVNIQQSKWYDRIWAAFIFFTRLPFWRLHEPSKDSYNAVVEYWPLTGWLTGGLMAATLWVSSLYLPYMLAVLLAIMVRLLITGALHEDGLADFLDGFGGGGSSRERILTIMKTAQLIMMMPYARKEEEAKAKMIYRKMDWRAGLGLAIQGLLPMVAFLWYTHLSWELIIFLPCIVMYFLYLLIWNKIRGYTGDCCGAVCLLVELTVYIVICAQ